MMRLKPCRLRMVSLCLVLCSLLSALYTINYMCVDATFRNDYYSRPKFYKSDRLDTRFYNGSKNNKLHQTCKEKRRFALLKMPKAGSSTVQNIFFRFGFIRNLTFVLPKYANIISYWPRIMHGYIIPAPEGRHYDILCSHVMYNRTAFMSILPSDSVFVSVIRHPLSHFISYLRFFHRNFFGNTTNALGLYLDRHAAFSRMRRPYKIPPNLMSDYFGMTEDDMSSTKTITDFIRKTDMEFDFVLILEMLDESLLVMKRKFCWEVEDILYVSKMIHNSIAKEGKHTRPQLAMFKSLASADYMLYEHFSNKLMDTILEEETKSGDFWKELKFYKETRHVVSGFCKSIRRIKGSRTLRIGESPWSKAFNVTSFKCRMLLMREIHLQRFIGQSQYGVENWEKLHIDRGVLH